MNKLIQSNLSVITIISILILSPVFPSAIELLRLELDYTRQQFLLEFWRIVSAHFVHASWAHASINIANILLLKIVFWEWLSWKRWASLLLFSASFISIGLYLYSPLSSYLGFSGIFLVGSDWDYAFCGPGTFGY